ncbi:hypothetical protein [Priestia aryabhattai]|uniref:hypothetical protein n=1 Tax=Priestia aryabhattai TaxID=412384 RepID=UPI0015F4BE78|nr:hypothetical protein [Priestia aryabhattai]
MKISEYIEYHIKDQGRTKVWVADRTEINYKSLITKLRTDCFTAYDLVKVSKVLHFSVDEMIEKLEESR